MTKSYKFFVAVIALLLICTVAFGASKAFAEPPLKDRVEILGTGTFQPKELYSDELINRSDSEVNIITALPTTELMFSEKLWTDSNGDGKITLTEDVYSNDNQENFFTDVLSREYGYPVLDIGRDDYYVVPLVNYAEFNDFVVVQFQLSNNNDNASLLNESQYWLDTKTQTLYISKELIDANLNNGTLNVRAEVVQIVEDIDSVTKDLGIFTVFNENIDNTYGLYSNTPNEVVEQPFKDWLVYGLEYQFIKPEYLAYVNAEDLEVFVNGDLLENDSWYYDETTGTIYIDCDAYLTQYIVVKFNDIKNPSANQAMLQSLQNGNMGQAGANDLPTLKAKMGDIKNLFVSNITFTEMPEVGDFDVCNSTAKVSYNSSRCDTEGLANALGTLCDTGLIDQMCEKALENASWSGDYVLGGTLAVTGQNEDQDEIGAISYNLALAEYYKNDTNAHNGYLTAALNAIEYYLGEYNGPFRSDWYVPAGGGIGKFGQHVYVAARTGTLANTFLGGTIDNVNEGYAMFDMSCCEMSMPFNGGIDGSNFEGNSWIAQTTIVDVDKQSKELLVCAWSASWHSSGHNQKILGFSRIPYTYDSDGYIQFSKENEAGELLVGAVYEIKGITDPNFSQTVTTTDAQITIQLPLGEYQLIEKVPPIGYIKESAPAKFEVTSAHSETNTALQVTVTDRKQVVNGTLTVYDEPAYYNNIGTSKQFIPVSGVKFDLYDADGRPIMTGLETNANGVISFSFDAIDTYGKNYPYLLQTSTVNNYRMGDDCINKIIIKPDDDGEWADTSGSDKTWGHGKYHLEPRQMAQIKSQVKDYDLTFGEDTRDTPAVYAPTEGPSQLHEGDAAYVSTIGAQYKLIAKSDLFLGYNSEGNAVTIPSGTRLTVCDDPTSTPNAANATSNPGKYKQAGSFTCSDVITSKEDGGKAYVSAYTVKVAGDNNLYPLPNGSYQWELIEPSAGFAFQNDKQSLSWKNSKTAISVPWEGLTTTKLVISGTDPVIEVRQRVQIQLYVKYYTDDFRIANDEYVLAQHASDFYTLTENELAIVDPKKIPSLDGHLQPNYRGPSSSMNTEVTKTVQSNRKKIDKVSTEKMTVKEDGEQVLYVQSEGLIANSIYELVNVTTIVDINTGEAIIPQVLGRYMVTDTNNEGAIVITKLGSEQFDSKQVIDDAFVPAVNVETTGQQASVSNLPNGIYVLRCLGAPDSYEAELAVANDMVPETQWSEETANVAVLTVNTSTLLHKETIWPGVTPQIAPDPSKPVGPSDDLPEQIDLPSDPTQIPTVTVEWVQKNQKNIAYRITDTVNITVDKDNKVEYDVQDKLPTTFAMFINNPNVRDQQETPTNWYTYEMGFYYEIPESAVPAAEKTRLAEAGQNAEDKLYEIDIEQTYIKVGDKYAKKFDTNVPNADDYIGKHIVLNPDSEGYNDNMSTVKTHHATISGALYNTKWLNDMLTQNADHEFDIFVVTRAKHHIMSFDTQEYVKTFPSTAGTLRIKVRELINLD